jgi:hypothetical protein
LKNKLAAVDKYYLLQINLDKNGCGSLVLCRKMLLANNVFNDKTKKNTLTLNKKTT